MMDSIIEKKSPYYTGCVKMILNSEYYRKQSKDKH